VIYEENVAVLATQNCLSKGLDLQCNPAIFSKTFQKRHSCLKFEQPDSAKILKTIVACNFGLSHLFGVAESDLVR
jgi:hypothetical protein